jgi:hypothetical protein
MKSGLLKEIRELARCANTQRDKRAFLDFGLCALFLFGLWVGLMLIGNGLVVLVGRWALQTVGLW